jgi:hypothetical protein
MAKAAKRWEDDIPRLFRLRFVDGNRGRAVGFAAWRRWAKAVKRYREAKLFGGKADEGAE